VINLLPPDDKKQIRAARSNVLLLRYNFLLIGVVVFLGLAVSFTYYYLGNSLQAANDTIAANAQREGTYSSTKAQADAFRSQLGDAKAVFDSQVDYSAALINIAHQIPDGAVITDLQLSEASFTTPLILDVNVKGKEQAAAVRDNFQNSPLFSGVKIGTVKKGTVNGYPYSIEVTVTLSKEAAK